MIGLLCPLGFHIFWKHGVLMESRSIIQVTSKRLSLLSMPQVYHVHGQMEMGLALLKAFFVGNLEREAMKTDCLYQILQSYFKSPLSFGSLCRLGKKTPNTCRSQALKGTKHMPGWIFQILETFSPLQCILLLNIPLQTWKFCVEVFILRF